MTDDEAWQRLSTAPVAVLATIGPDGSPHLVPFTFAPVEPRSIVCAVDSKPKASRSLRRLDNIRRDPRVTVLAHHYDDDWTTLWWVRAQGRAAISDIGEPLLLERYPQLEDHTLGPWVTITIENITGWSAQPG